MYDYPLDAIGQYFEMPTKEAFLDKVKPQLAFLRIDDGFIMIGLAIVAFIGLAFLIRNRNRARRR